MAKLGMTLIMAAIISFTLLASTGSGDQPPEAQPGKPVFELPQKHVSPLPAAAQKGQELYEYYCAPCHGKTGNGDGFNSSQLTTPPAKHADAALMSAISDEQMQQVIKKGGPALGLSPQMPSWGLTLTDPQVSDLVAFIRELPKI
jgi:mono/diheme cytochrome c family protein